ncbi:MAG: hypothetical protein NT084_06240 [Bacteroidetes bacterium]|nr:hypothetical protein [Bacteroidota bacterium]
MTDAVVPNPKREVRINFNIEEVKKALKTLPEFVKPTILKIANDTMNFYQFEAPAKGIFSMGMFLEISLHEISEKQTVIQFEGRRAIGWIDSTHETTETYNFINGCISMLGKALKGELK